MSDKPSGKDPKDLKITDLPKASGAKIDDANVKGGQRPRGITFTGDEVDTQTGD